MVTEQRFLNQYHSFQINNIILIESQCQQVSLQQQITKQNPLVSQGTESCFLPPIKQGRNIYFSHSQFKEKIKKNVFFKEALPLHLFFSALKQRSVCQQQHLLNEKFLVLKLHFATCSHANLNLSAKSVKVFPPTLEK